MRLYKMVGEFCERDGRVRGARISGTSRRGHTHSEDCSVTLSPRHA
jgi:hypothetical protein